MTGWAGVVLCTHGTRQAEALPAAYWRTFNYSELLLKVHTRRKWPTCMSAVPFPPPPPSPRSTHGEAAIV